MSHIPTLDELVDRAAQQSPRAAKKRTRLTATPDFAPGVNQTTAGAKPLVVERSTESGPQPVGAQHVMTQCEGGVIEAADSKNGRAGGQETEKPVNHTQVVVPQETPTEMQQLLVKIGVNLQVNQLGRKRVLDAFMRGRLVSLLAMGLTLRQSAAALGLSHNAIWKELKKNAELSEQVNAARFQAQIEPLLVILRESKRSWRAATWLVNYLSKSLSRREESADESSLYANERSEDAKERSEAEARERAESWHREKQIWEEVHRRTAKP